MKNTTDAMTLTELQALSPDELRVRVAELMGWYLNDELWWHDQSRTPLLEEMLPDYEGSLDSCREFEDAMTDEEFRVYQRKLWSIIPGCTFRLYGAATPLQKCIAYILTKSTKTEGAE